MLGQPGLRVKEGTQERKGRKTQGRRYREGHLKISKEVWRVEEPRQLASLHLGWVPRDRVGSQSKN